MDKKVSIRILQLKNNFYWDNVSEEREALGEYCVIGYFDALDISQENVETVTEINTWAHLGRLTSLHAGIANCRMLVCVTEQQEEDRQFWAEHSDPLFFVTMVRIKAGMSADDMNCIINELGKNKKRIGYLSYDHSEIIVVSRTNRYSEGIKGVKELRNLCGAVKTYTVFAMKEDFLESYESIKRKLIDESVFCRLHCMVKDYAEAEKFLKELEQQLNKRNGRQIRIRKFETFGGYDWLMEIDDVSISSMLECYKMKNLLTHANKIYNKAFFNIESEILVDLEERDGRDMDRRTETSAEGDVYSM